MKALSQDPTDQVMHLQDFMFKFLPAALPAQSENAQQWGIYPPFYLNKNETVSGIEGVDIDFEPYSNDWSQMAPDEIEAYMNYLTNIANNGRVGKLSVTISGNPNAVTALGSENIKTLFNIAETVNLMTYDYHGAFDSPGKTNFHSPLFCNPNLDKQDTFNTNSAVDVWAKQGVDLKKLLIGAVAYGREVSNVEGATDINNCLFANFNDQSGKAPLYNNIGLDNTGVGNSIKQRVDSGELVEKFDINSGSTYACSKDFKTFVSYDTLDSVTLKACYVLHKGLGGIALWDLGSDKDNLLIQRIIDVKANSTQYCTGDFSYDNIDHLMTQCGTGLAGRDKSTTLDHEEL